MKASHLIAALLIAALTGSLGPTPAFALRQERAGAEEIANTLTGLEETARTALRGFGAAQATALALLTTQLSGLDPQHTVVISPELLAEKPALQGYVALLQQIPALRHRLVILPRGEEAPRNRPGPQQTQDAPAAWSEAITTIGLALAAEEQKRPVIVFARIGGWQDSLRLWEALRNAWRIPHPELLQTSGFVPEHTLNGDADQLALDIITALTGTAVWLAPDQGQLRAILDNPITPHDIQTPSLIERPVNYLLQPQSPRDWQSTEEPLLYRLWVEPESNRVMVGKGRWMKAPEDWVPAGLRFAPQPFTTTEVELLRRARVTAANAEGQPLGAVGIAAAPLAALSGANDGVWASPPLIRNAMLSAKVYVSMRLAPAAGLEEGIAFYTSMAEARTAHPEVVGFEATIAKKGFGTPEGVIVVPSISMVLPHTPLYFTSEAQTAQANYDHFSERFQSDPLFEKFVVSTVAEAPKNSVVLVADGELRPADRHDLTVVPISQVTTPEAVFAWILSQKLGHPVPVNNLRIYRNKAGALFAFA